MHTTYLYHVLIWMVPVVLLQWGLSWRVFRRNLRAILLPPIVIGTWLVLADTVAVMNGIWFFDPQQTLGLRLGVLPLEEVLFFYLTALLVSQTFVMFLPRSRRRE
ncbi:MAG TPA: lycopene cyclase domain-containing protein [Candidatus Kapabacteria bacterium]|nr:lycopene cyclase domain-containing protein [Candidatus Kapabacteria bacterium]